jgi:fumarate hydratase subunit beta
MNNRTEILLPMTAEQARALRAGDLLLLSGAILTARDAAHKRLADLIGRGEPLPVELAGQSLYYVGPCPAGPGQIIGSCGPTTSGRMDDYTPDLLRLGLRAMIGKGLRSPAVIAAMLQYGAVYLGATGGAGALLAQCVRAVETVAWPDLGTEAICRLTVERFPAVVLIDSLGNSLYETGRAAYRLDKVTGFD